MRAAVLCDLEYVRLAWPVAFSVSAFQQQSHTNTRERKDTRAVLPHLEVLVQRGEQHLLRVLVWDVLHHQRRALVLAAEDARHVERKQPLLLGLALGVGGRVDGAPLGGGPAKQETTEDWTGCSSLHDAGWLGWRGALEAPRFYALADTIQMRACNRLQCHVLHWSLQLVRQPCLLQGRCAPGAHRPAQVPSINRSPPNHFN